MPIVCTVLCMKMGKSNLITLILILLSHQIFADNEENSTSVLRDLSSAISATANVTEGPQLKRRCTDCIPDSSTSGELSSSTNFNHTMFINGHLATPYFIEISHLNDSIPYSFTFRVIRSSE